MRDVIKRISLCCSLLALVTLTSGCPTLQEIISDFKAKVVHRVEEVKNKFVEMFGERYGIDRDLIEQFKEMSPAEIRERLKEELEKIKNLLDAAEAVGVIEDVNRVIGDLSQVLVDIDQTGVITYVQENLDRLRELVGDVSNEEIRNLARENIEVLSEALHNVNWEHYVGESIERIDALNRIMEEVQSKLEGIEDQTLATALRQKLAFIKRILLQLTNAEDDLDVIFFILDKLEYVRNRIEGLEGHDLISVLQDEISFITCGVGKLEGTNFASSVLNLISGLKGHLDQYLGMSDVASLKERISELQSRLDQGFLVGESTLGEINSRIDETVGAIEGHYEELKDTELAAYFDTRFRLIRSFLTDPTTQPLTADQLSRLPACGETGPEPPTPARCGDQIVQGEEPCDDGNQVDTDSCTNLCRVAVCGDGIVFTGVEECDDGNQDETDTCTSQCRNAVCGDNLLQAGVEPCDDGNRVTENCAYGLTSCQICDAHCQWVAGTTSFCGDGTLDTSNGEICDDANRETEVCRYGVASCQVCDSDCRLASGATSLCGDGSVNSSSGETCDDGNQITETCTYGLQSCTICDRGCRVRSGRTSYCGDRRVDKAQGEECDAGPKPAPSNRCADACRRCAGVNERADRTGRECCRGLTLKKGYCLETRR